MVARILIAALVVVFAAIPAGSGQAQTGDPADGLEGIISAYEVFVREIDPSEAARSDEVGLSSWPDVTPAALERQRERLTELLSALDALPSDSRDEIDFQILHVIVSDQLAVLKLDPARIPFTGDWGFHSSLLAYARRVDIRSEDDARNYIALLNGTAEHFRAQKANMLRGVETGYTAHVDPLSVTIEQFAEQLVDDPEDSDLFRPFLSMTGLSEDKQRTVLRRGRNATGSAVDAFEDMYEFLANEYRPAARSSAGIYDLPGGREAYETFVRTHTTRADLTPERVHEIGLAEVRRIRAEMEDIKEETGFEGSFAEFLTFLRTSDQFYATSPEDLLEKAARISKRLDAILPAYFGKLPRLTYGVEPVDPAIAPGFTTGRYSGGDAKSGTPGTYLVNTYRLDQRPLYELPALSAHEAVPGHHLQIALAQELENVPRFRQSYYATAFGEGWALYAERLAGEAGIYQTPYERFGALSYEMWRACRLVADTGLHYLAWSRDEAEACFRENTALAELNIQTEVTRYIGWPGQALGYKIGEITIVELRREARDVLGDRFDIRRFHDAVLEDGSMPLGMLEQKIRTWISAEQNN